MVHTTTFLYLFLSAAPLSSAQACTRVDTQEELCEAPWNTDQSTLLQSRVAIKKEHVIDPALIEHRVKNVDLSTTKVLAGVPCYNYHFANPNGMTPSLLELAEQKTWIVNFNDECHDNQIHDFCEIAAGVGSAVCQLEGHPDSAGLEAAVLNANEAEYATIQNKFEAKHKNCAVVYIEPDMPLTAIPEVPEAGDSDQDEEDPLQLASGNPTWGLDRIDDASGLDSDYSVPTDSNAGAGVHVYVADSGIRHTHTEFGGRAFPFYDAYGSNVWYELKEERDCSKSTDAECGLDRSGHGTHCAGTIAGESYGVSKKANIYSAKVLPDRGGGVQSALLGSLEAVITRGQRPAVWSASLGGPGVAHWVDDAFKRTVAAGVVVSVAAGNENDDACKYSPAYSSWAITVGASNKPGSDNVDKRAGFSNYGPCVDIFAPGTKIKAAGISSDTKISTMSGTSMSCPHVSGVAALYLSDHPGFDPEDTWWLMMHLSQKDILYDAKSPTTNRFLFTGGETKDHEYFEQHIRKGMCSVVDGSAMSSAYPCKCGISTSATTSCSIGQVCTATSDSDGVCEFACSVVDGSALSLTYPCKCGTSITSATASCSTGQVCTANSDSDGVCEAVQGLQDLGSNGCTSKRPCTSCQGDCDSDSGCAHGFKCFQRDNSDQLVPGCFPGGSGDVGGHDYCYWYEDVCSVVDGSALSSAYPCKCGISTSATTSCSTSQVCTANSDSDGVCEAVQGLQDLGGNGCTSSSPCTSCQGDCDSDSDCATGLKCFQRGNSDQLVPGCIPGGSGDVGSHDYCYEVPPDADSPGWINPKGKDCAAYASNGWCANGGFASGYEWTGGKKWNYPEHNCMVCGKGNAYTCVTGQVQSDGSRLFQTRDNSYASCAALCSSTAGCVGFDYTTNKNKKACRGVGAGQTPRSEGGGDARQYCTQATTAAPTTAAPTTAAPEAPMDTDSPGWINPKGKDCADYAKNGWCANGGFASGYEWTGGKKWNYPELNCMVCGKGIDSPGWTNPKGKDCAAYASNGWCANGGFASGYEWTGGKKWNYPERNCMVCGK